MINPRGSQVKAMLRLQVALGDSSDQVAHSVGSYI